MSVLEALLATTVATSEMTENDLLFVFSKGERKYYPPGEHLFHEGSPGLWAGIIEDGLVEIVRECNGTKHLIAVNSRGATIADAVVMGDALNDVSAFTRTGATVWQVSRDIWQATLQSYPDIYYRIVGRMGLRLRYAADQLSLARDVLRKSHDQVLQEGWLKKEVLDYVLKEDG